MIPKNWKTTLGGMAAILTVVVKVIGFITGQAAAPDFEDAGMLAAGAGLIAARDHDRGATY